jgi:dTDP-4-amino-4,6-dideoxygalactose transaminase
MTDFQAALGISQLKRLNTFVKKRRELVLKYRQLLKDIENITLFTDEFDKTTAFHLFVVQIDFEKLELTRTEVIDKLKAEGIGAQYHYIPVYRHPVFQKQCGDVAEYFPEMEAYYKQALSLPLYVDMKESGVVSVVKALKKVITSSKVSTT